jgi:hypothetical protein
MFHVNIDTGKFVQGRIYPQGNDGSTDLYAKFRSIVQKEFVKLMELGEDKWKVKSVSSDDTWSYGSHYKDYNHFDDCKVFYPSEKGNNGHVEIGAENIYCPHCGNVTWFSDKLSHDGCDVPVEIVVPTESMTVDADTLSVEQINTIENTILEVDSNDYIDLSVNANDLRTTTIDRSAIYTAEDWNYTTSNTGFVRIDTTNDAADGIAWGFVNPNVTVNG